MKIFPMLMLLIILTLGVFGGLEAKKIYDRYQVLEQQLASVQQQLSSAKQELHSLKLVNAQMKRALDAQKGRDLQKSYSKGIKSLYE